MQDMNFSSRSPCKYQPARKNDGAAFFLDLVRTVVGVAVGALIAMSIARAYVTWEIKQGVKDVQREMRRNAD